MQNITLISTVHEANGRCNAEELCRIISDLNPEVIFLEALPDTYSGYDQLIFKSFGVFHKKLEIHAIQLYSTKSEFKYVPVLDSGMSDSFYLKYDKISESPELNSFLNTYNSIAERQGFEFLNSSKSTELQEEMRVKEIAILNNNEINKEALETINEYEDSMLKKINSYCQNNQFERAIFMCGVAHRTSLIEKLIPLNEKDKLKWGIFGN